MLRHVDTLDEEMLIDSGVVSRVVPPNKRLQPTAFGAGMRGTSCQQSLWLLERVLPESAAAEPHAVMLHMSRTLFALPIWFGGFFLLALVLCE